MSGRTAGISYKRAREILGVTPQASAAELRRAFGAAAKRAHPDRAGGDADTFREVVAAYHLLRAPPGRDLMFHPPAATPPRRAARPLVITPLLALNGGEALHRLETRRTLRLTLPAGLRNGDTVRAGEHEFVVAVRGDPKVMVRGDDLWMTVRVDAAVLAKGGRLAVETPLGKRIVWITKAAGARGLVRLPGQGLPKRGDHRQGHLFLRLAIKDAAVDSPARTLLRRFAAAWAA